MLSDPAPICPNCGERDYSASGDRPCFCAMQAEPEPPEPTVQDYCYPHPFYGPEADPAIIPESELHQAGRCYCGEKRYPIDRQGNLVA